MAHRSAGAAHHHTPRHELTCHVAGSRHASRPERRRREQLQGGATRRAHLQAAAANTRSRRYSRSTTSCTCSRTHPSQTECAPHGPHPSNPTTGGQQTAGAAAAASAQTLEQGPRVMCMHTAAMIWLRCLPLSSVTLALRGETQ